MKQITILSRDKENLIAKITKRLSEGGINLESITGTNLGEQSIVTITTHNDDKALFLLQKYSDLQVICEDALIVHIEDELGALAKLACRFAEKNIDIRSIRFVERHEGYSLVAISTARTDDALALVKDILMA